jgi:hypothetical protein
MRKGITARLRGEAERCSSWDFPRLFVCVLSTDQLSSAGTPFEMELARQLKRIV